MSHVITDDGEPEEEVGCGDDIFEAILARAQADAAKGKLDLEQVLAVQRAWPAQQEQELLF